MTSPSMPTKTAAWNDMAGVWYMEQLAGIRGFPRERIARARVLVILVDSTSGPAEAQELVNAMARSFDWWPGEREFQRACIHFANSRRPMPAAAPAEAPAAPLVTPEEAAEYEREREAAREQDRRQTVERLKERLAYLRQECKRVERINPSSDHLARMEKERDRVSFELKQWEKGAAL